MIRQVDFKNYRDEELELNLAKPYETGYAIRSISGISPATANITTTDITSGDGSWFNSARVENRNIVIDIIYMYHNIHNLSIEDLRHNLYRYFPLKKPVTITFHTDNRVSKIVGYVESNEVEPFSNLEGSSISLICPDPFFYQPGKSTADFGLVEPLFHFPFSNNSLDEPLLIFGIIEGNGRHRIWYNGDSEVGFVMIVHFLDRAANITVAMPDENQKIFIDTAKVEATMARIIEGFTTIKRHDEIIINSIPGQKGVYFRRKGREESILNTIGVNMQWFKLRKGENIFTFNAEKGKANLEFNLEYSMAYEGV